MMEDRSTSSSNARVPILCFHRVVADGSQDSVWTLGLRQFEKEIQRLFVHGYRTISLSDLRRWQSQQLALPRKAMVLTFDDGHEGFLERVAPVLDKYGFRAILFVIAGLLGKEVQLMGGPPFKLMPPEEARSLANAGFEIQSHGTSHTDFTRLSSSELQHELRESVRILEAITKREVRFLAYPYGRSTSRVRDEVQAAGFTAACTIDPGRTRVDDDPFGLRRNLVLCNNVRWLIPWMRNRANQAWSELDFRKSGNRT